MNEIFKAEWELYLKNGIPEGFGSARRTTHEQGFDPQVEIGDIRVFADMSRPLVALVIADRGKVGYRIVPISPFTVPASSREMLVGERVYQLWNACTASRTFVERSWRVEKLDTIDVEEIVEATKKVASGTRSVDPTARAYENAFEVVTWDCRGLMTENGVQKSWWRRRASWGVAAMLMICCGIVGLWYEEVLRDRRVAAIQEESKAIKAARDAIERKILDAEEPLLDERIEEEPPMEEIIEPKVEHLRKMRAMEVQEARMRQESRIVMKEMVGSRTPGSIGRMCGSVSFAGLRPALSGERYAAVTENAFVRPTDEPLSTFGLDVDTSSYTLMRSSLTAYRHLPDASSVRIEEYVNYFKYDYPEPQREAPIAVACELAPCPWNPQHKLLRLGVQAKRVEEANLPPCNLTFLVDVSGSMLGEDRIELLKKSLKMLVGKLRDEDHVAIVTYANDTQVRLPSVSGREKTAINHVIDSLSAGGGTYGAAGIQLAYEEARKNFDKKANNRVILVTDGDFNIGISSPEELEKFIATKRESGVFLTVFGVGRGNYMDDRMKKLANAGNGNYAYLDSLLEAKKVMLNEFGGTLMTVAKDVKIQVEFNSSEVGAYRLLGYENRKLAARDFNDDKKDAGEIGSGHTMTAFYEIVPAGADENTGVDPLKYQKRVPTTSGEFCTVKLRYKLPDSEKSVLIEESHTAAEMTRSDPSEDFRFASAVVEYALLLKNSQYKADASFAKLLERARDAKGADREGYRAEFIRLAEQAEMTSSPAKKSEIEVEVEI